MALMKKLRAELADHLQKFQIEGGNNTDLLIDGSNNKSIEYSKQLVSNGLIHACDISTSLREFDLSTVWADLLFEEFFNQGDCEKAQGIEVSMLCDRNTTKVAPGQEGFIKFVVMPIFITLSNIVPEIKDVQLESGDKNLTHWKNRVESEKALAEKEEKMKQIIS